MQVYLFTFWRVYLQDYGGYIASFVFCCWEKNKKKTDDTSFLSMFLIRSKIFLFFNFYQQQLNILYRKTDGFHILHILNNIDFKKKNEFLAITC